MNFISVSIVHAVHTELTDGYTIECYVRPDAAIVNVFFVHNSYGLGDNIFFLLACSFVKLNKLANERVFISLSLSFSPPVGFENETSHDLIDDVWRSMVENEVVSWSIPDALNG